MNSLDSSNASFNIVKQAKGERYPFQIGHILHNMEEEGCQAKDGEGLALVEKAEGGEEK
jgi:hypothetical protein